MSPCKDIRGAQDIPQPSILLQPSPFPRWILYKNIIKIYNSPQILILVPGIPLHPALTCFPLGPGLPGTPWGPGLPWKHGRMSHGVTRDRGERERKRAKAVTHLEAIIPLLAQVTLAALLALGESQGELWWQREGQEPPGHQGGWGNSQLWMAAKLLGQKSPNPHPFGIHCTHIAGDRGSRRDDPN